jgi:hypothetical protein
MSERIINGRKPSKRKPHVLYGLVDPRTGELFYIGRSKGGISKMVRHVQPAIMRRDRAKPKGERVLELSFLGLMPTFLILETHRSWDECRHRERVLIAELRNIYNLLNDEHNRPRLRERLATA